MVWPGLRLMKLSMTRRIKKDWKPWRSLRLRTQVLGKGNRRKTFWKEEPEGRHQDWQQSTRSIFPFSDYRGGSRVLASGDGWTWGLPDGDGSNVLKGWKTKETSGKGWRDNTNLSLLLNGHLSHQIEYLYL